jgi:hypothetical protein
MALACNCMPLIPKQDFHSDDVYNSQQMTMGLQEYSLVDAIERRKTSNTSSFTRTFTILISHQIYHNRCHNLLNIELRERINPYNENESYSNPCLPPCAVDYPSHGNLYPFKPAQTSFPQKYRFLRSIIAYYPSISRLHHPSPNCITLQYPLTLAGLIPHEACTAHKLFPTPPTQPPHPQHLGSSSPSSVDFQSTQPHRHRPHRGPA